MHHIGNYLLWALFACILWQGSSAEDQSGYICIIDEPNPKIPGNNRDADNEIKAKLDKLEVQIGEVQSKQEAQLQEVQTKMKETQAKLEESLLTVQTRLETQLQAVLNQLQAVSKNIDSAKVEIPDLVRIAPFGFERIGTRYFRIVNEYVDWYTAKRRCVEMGGQLAVIQSEEEKTAIAAKLSGSLFWLGIHYEPKDNEYVSVVTDQKAFLKWGESQPNKRNNDRDENCICIFSHLMHDYSCDTKMRFICQA
ncbi:CD209 antigen-like protein E [Drosophila kikkawai]|uniref:CD209 antigen-like protein E n=1 Tax=Drosophila kikkawai TaxID=30033 RepID=A0ABM4GA56_DROKI